MEVKADTNHYKVCLSQKKMLDWQTVPPVPKNARTYKGAAESVNKNGRGLCVNVEQRDIEK
jgi:hypothetical protein